MLDIPGAEASVEGIIRSMPIVEKEHMLRVGLLVGVMAEKIDKLGIYREDASDFEKAAAFHDIGKAWVPKDILLKQGKLTMDEMIIIFKHPVFARDLFAQIYEGKVSGIPEKLMGLSFYSAVYHHEWWNGKGYPYGLCSFDIPLIARVTSVCDAYDAITGKRVYKPACSHAAACRELEKNAGTQFDPTLVKVFMDNEEEIAVFMEQVRQKMTPDIVKSLAQPP